MKKYILKIRLAINIILISALVWISISTMVQAFLCPKMSQTELFLRIPKSFVCNWDNCNLKN